MELANPRAEFTSLALPFVRGASLEGSVLAVDVGDPEREAPALVRRLVELGAEIRAVRREERTLEEVYLELMGRGDGAD